MDIIIILGAFRCRNDPFGNFFIAKSLHFCQSDGVKTKFQVLNIIGGGVGDSFIGHTHYRLPG